MGAYFYELTCYSIETCSVVLPSVLKVKLESPRQLLSLPCHRRVYTRDALDICFVC